jgi:hypothetical protein
MRITVSTDFRQTLWKNVNSTFHSLCPLAGRDSLVHNTVSNTGLLGSMGTDSIITWRTVIVPDGGAKLSVAEPRSRDNNYKMSSCCCTQSTTVHGAGESFSIQQAAAFQLNLVGWSWFTKSLWNMTNLLWSQVTNVFPNVHFKSTVVNFIA